MYAMHKLLYLAGLTADDRVATVLFEYIELIWMDLLKACAIHFYSALLELVNTNIALHG